MAGKSSPGWKLHLDDLPKISRRTVFGAGFAVVSVIVVILVAKMIAPFLGPLLWAAVLSIMAYPLNKAIGSATRSRRTLSAIITTALVVLLIFSVTFFLGRTMVQESRQVYRQIVQSIDEGEAEGIIQTLAGLPDKILPGFFEERDTEVIEAWMNNVATSALGGLDQKVTSWINQAIGNASKFLLDIFILVVTLFFLLRQGEGWFALARESVPLSPRLRNLIIERFTTTFQAIVYGVLLGATIETTWLTFGYWLFGVPLPIFLGVLTFFLILFPLIGAVFIWLPATIWLFMTTDSVLIAAGFLLWCLVSLVGILLKPAIIGTRADLPMFFVLMSIMGGVAAFGAVGVILGPILLAIAISMARIYREIAVTGKA